MAATALSTIPRAEPIRPPVVLQSRNLTQRLPPDVIRNALSYLSPQEQAAFRATCRTAGFEILSVTEQACMNGKIHWEELRRLELISGRRFSSPLILHVNLSWFQGNWTEMLQKILHDFPLLNSFDFSYGSDAFTDHHLHMISQERLLSIRLYSCFAITGQGLLSLGRNCPNIRFLNLGGCYQLLPENLIELAAHFSHLRHLVLPATDHPHNEQVIISFVRRSPLLESLDLSGCDHCSQNAVIEIAECCPHLRRFCMGDLSIERAHSIGMPAFQRMAAKLLELESLTLDWYLPREADVTPLAEGFPRLHTVKISKFSWTTSSIRQIFQAFPRIRCLILNGCLSLLNSDLPLDEGCQLHELHLRSCSRISQDAINRLIERSPSLQMVTLPDGTIWRRPLRAAAPATVSSSSSSLPMPSSTSTSSSSSSSMPRATPLLPRNPHGVKRSHDDDSSTRTTKRRE